MGKSTDYKINKVEISTNGAMKLFLVSNGKVIKI